VVHAAGVIGQNLTHTNVLEGSEKEGQILTLIYGQINTTCENLVKIYQVDPANLSQMSYVLKKMRKMYAARAKLECWQKRPRQHSAKVYVTMHNL